MAGNETWFRRRFRSAEAAINKAGVIGVLSELRISHSPREYASIYGAFRTAAPSTLHALTIGPKTTSELVWARRELTALPLSDEFNWAEHWLIPHVSRLNAFRCCATAIEEHVIDGNLKASKDLLDEYVQLNGWSLWAVELRAALIQMSQGTAAQREWLGQLQAKTMNSVPGLLFEVFGDRNDETYSYDAVYGKCMHSFPRFGAIADWLVDYLKFRALAHIDNPISALPRILSRDITSSLLDYYEDVIEALAYVEVNESLVDARISAAQLVSSLVSAGFKDRRLTKLAVSFDAVSMMHTSIQSQPPCSNSMVYLGAFKTNLGDLPAGIKYDLRKCEDDGAPAYELVGRLLKWGVNLRSLNIGPAVALAALRSTLNTLDERTLPLNIYLLSETFCIDDATALPTEKTRAFLHAYLISHGKEVSHPLIIKPSTWELDKTFPYGGPIYLWLMTELLGAEDFGELNYLISLVHHKSPYWERQCAKFSMLIAVKEGRLLDALNLLEHWYQKHELYALEFPADTLFYGRKWSDFKLIDPVIVGLVAHREFEARGSANVGYICKMACRAFLQSGQRDHVVKSFDNATVVRQMQIVSFLRDVWIEQNLSMCHQFQTTAEVRVERMGVLQHLLSWDTERASEYAEAIKDLTFDQTLQKGLERIDQTRVFVNESAISRWAVKELEQDYERWKRMTDTTTGSRTVDDMVRQYVLDKKNIEVLQEFANGKPTAADALLIDILDRLFKRFLLDPTDGLDTYLSVRIRHGSLRGTILGPLEEQGLLYSTSGFSEEAFETRWHNLLQLSAEKKAHLILIMQGFSSDIRKSVDEFVEQRVQIQSEVKPEGAFQQVLSPFFAKLIAASLAERPPTFHTFLCIAYFAFWKLVEIGLQNLRNYVDQILISTIHGLIEDIIAELRTLGHEYLPLVTTLTTVSTMIRSQCDSVADWFQLPSMVGGEKYQLPDAIEIASVATKNVHRGFEAEVILMSLPAKQLPLTTSGLAVLMDCLFVIFENCWKHSGLSTALPPIELFTAYDPIGRILTIQCKSSLSKQRKLRLLDGELTMLRTKYLGELPLDLIRIEGGSGFPKLARLTRAVDKNHCANPFDFGIDGEQWFTSLSLPLYEQEGAFEAYE